MTISVTTHNGLKKKRSIKKVDWDRQFDIIVNVFKISLPLALLFIVAVVKVKLTSETEKMNKKAISVQKDIYDLERESANYAMQIEKKSGKHVLAKVKDLNLELQFPKPGQMRKLELPEEPVIKKTGPKAKPVQMVLGARKHAGL